MTGISYITDGKGKASAVVIDLKKHRRLWEDFYDALLVDERKNEERIPWHKAKKMLKDV